MRRCLAALATCRAPPPCLPQTTAFRRTSPSRPRWRCPSAALRPSLMGDAGSATVHGVSLPKIRRDGHSRRQRTRQQSQGEPALVAGIRRLGGPGAPNRGNSRFDPPRGAGGALRHEVRELGGVVETARFGSGAAPDYWLAKVELNQTRDRRNDDELRADGGQACGSGSTPTWGQLLPRSLGSCASGSRAPVPGNRRNPPATSAQTRVPCAREAAANGAATRKPGHPDPARTAPLQAGGPRFEPGTAHRPGNHARRETRDRRRR
jgi:hypothetical protein